MLTRALFAVALPLLVLSSSAKADPEVATSPEPSSASAATEAKAPSPSEHLHDGFYFRDAAGLGFTSFSADGPYGRTVMSSQVPSLSESSVLLLVGGTPARGFVIGGGLEGMSASGHLQGGEHDGQSVGATQLTLGPFVDYFPDPAGGFHVGAQVGLSGVLMTRGRSATALSLGGTIFGGYDWFVGKQTSVGVMAIVSGALPSELDYGNGNPSGYRVAPLSASLAFTFLVH